MNALIGLFRPRGRHHATRKHAAPSARRDERDYDDKTMTLFEQWGRAERACRTAGAADAIIARTLITTKSIDAALRMTNLLRDMAVAGGAR